MKAATVYDREGILYLSPSSLTTAGVWIGTEPLIRLELGRGSIALGESVNSVLSASRENVPHPTDWSGLIKPLLQSAGVKSWSMFMKSAKCVYLRLDGNDLRLIPHQNLGGKEGFRAIEDQMTTLSFPSYANAIADAVIDSLSRCQ